jgi:glycosyltransferase involved in cell wall biosynthesis
VTSTRRAIVVGFDYHAKYLARVLNEHSTRWQLRAFPSTRRGILGALWALRRCDVLISFGGPGPSVALAEAAHAAGISILVVWAGSDVTIAAQNPFDLAITKRHGYDNVAVAPWLVEELHEIGIEAKTLAVGAVNAVETIAPLPNMFRVLTYLPEPRREFYGEKRVYELARAMPGVRFTVLGPGGVDRNAPENVSFAGHVDDVPARIDASTVLLRLTEHDGASVLVLEALARGRHVVWTHDYPGVLVAHDTLQAFTALSDLYESHRRGTLEPNRAGIDFVRANFAPKDVAAKFEAHLDGLVDDRPAYRNGHRKRTVAISGLGLFSAEVAKHVELQRSEWKPTILSTNSRLEVFASLFTLLRSDVWYSIGSPVTDRWVYLFARLLRKPRVIHWVGSDIEYFRNTRALHKQLHNPAIKHLTEVTWTADELQTLGLSSDIVPLPLRHYSGSVKPLPKRFTILLYLPKTRPEFYGKRECERLLRHFAPSDIRVFVVGGGRLNAPEGLEVHNLGWRDDLRAIFDEVTVLVRLTPRDGLSLMVLEALSFGRYVMWSKPFPHSMQINSRSDLVDSLQALLDRHEAGTLEPQREAAEMIRSQYSSELAVDKILAAWESVR